MSMFESVFADLEGLEVVRAQRWGAAMGLLAPGEDWQFAELRGRESFYPASVVKSFLMGYVAHCWETGLIERDKWLDSACRDMVVDSNNDATGYVLDRVCMTTPGPELGAEELTDFAKKRSVVSDWYLENGMPDVRVHNRTFNEAPYGRERQLITETGLGRNVLSPWLSCNFMARLWNGEMWGDESRSWLLGLHARNEKAGWPNDVVSPQGLGFLGRDLENSAALYSKAGWTSEVRHDMALVVEPGGKVLSLTLMTEGLERDSMIGDFGKAVMQRLGFATKMAP